MNITVYLGANPGNDPALVRAVRELGAWIGESGHALVYGGSKSGLMGELAESVLLAGGEVTGVEPQFFVDAGFVYDAITRLIVTRDMSERKAKMIALGDAFIAFPGGTGTLEEIAEVMSKVSLKHLDAPCILYNLNGYYDPLKAQLERMIALDLSSREKQAGIWFADSLDQIRGILEGEGKRLSAATLLRRLTGGITPAERAALESGEELVISRYNRETLLRMLNTDVSRYTHCVDPAEVEAMRSALQGFLDRHMPDRPEGHRWIMLSCIFLAFVAREPLHPQPVVGWQRRQGACICPAREVSADSLCRWCVCRGEA